MCRVGEHQHHWHIDAQEEEGEVVEEEEGEITTAVQSSTAMQQSFTHAQGNCFFQVNKVEEKGKEEGDEIRTTMQSSVAVLQSCTCQPRQLFLSSKQ